MEQSNDFIMYIKIRKYFDESIRQHFLKFEFYPNKLTTLQAKKISDAYSQYFFKDAINRLLFIEKIPIYVAKKKKKR